MKTLLILSTVFFGSFWAVVQTQIDDTEEQAYHRELSICRHELWDLRQKIKMGPKPYCLDHSVPVFTSKMHDSIMIYLSHYTRGELLEIRSSSPENHSLDNYIARLIHFKDSLDLATKGYVGDVDE